jgi:hypothetical protein
MLRALRALPDLLVLRDGDLDSPLVALMVDEIVEDEPGQEAVLDGLLDLWLIAVLRAWFARPEAAPGWYRASDDPIVGQALRMLHHSPSTVDGRELRATGVSRAALARRFQRPRRRAADERPHRVRIALAGDLLREPGATIGLRGRPHRLRQLVRAQHRLQARPRDQPAQHRVACGRADELPPRCSAYDACRPELRLLVPSGPASAFVKAGAAAAADSLSSATLSRIASAVAQSVISVDASPALNEATSVFKRRPSASIVPIRMASLEYPSSCALRAT